MTYTEMYKHALDTIIGQYLTDTIPGLMLTLGHNKWSQTHDLVGVAVMPH